ncbi:MAG TPA: aminodeoxychorismate lyase [Gammaproteobacteria bacterium]|nr:aminodeoxychorismate lyase [Gammaproteobacteria bacterium]
MQAWINGQPAESISLADRGLAYGDGLFETIKVRDGRALLLERHLLRLQEGCQRLAIPFELQVVRQELHAYMQQLGDGVCKLILTRGSGQRGYTAPTPCFPQRILQASSLPQWPAAYAQQGIELFACLLRLSEQPLLAGLKHLNRLEQVLARAEWTDPAYAEGLLLDGQGRVVDCVFSNVFIVKDAQLITPALHRAGVAGVMRAELLARAEAAGIDVMVSDISLAQLLQADEVFTCNSLYGIWPVLSYTTQRWSVGPLTRKLQQLITDLVDE